jgi:hypothetical protein
MGKTTQTKEDTAVVEAKPAGAVALYVDMQQDSNIGREQMETGDMALPYILLLQALSPQVKKGDQRVDGAEEGDFYNNVSQELYSGEDGFDFIPAAFQKAWVEWAPRASGGGWVAAHPSDDIMSMTKQDSNGFDVRVDNGNIIIATYYYFGLILDDEGGFQPGIIALARTGMKKGRKLNSLISGLQVTGDGGRKFNPPMFAQIYHVKATPESNAKGDFFSWDFTYKGLIEDADLYATAKRFAESVKTGAVRAGAMSDVETEAEDPNAPM